jgi:effector-binding domain-containing protein
VSLPSVTVQRRSVEEIPTAVIAKAITWDTLPDVWAKMLDQVHEFLKGADVSGAGRNVMLYRDDVPNVEVGVEVVRSFVGQGDVKRSKLPGGEVAYAVHSGPYEDLPEVRKAVRDWCDANRLEVTGPRWEIYGHMREDAEPETTVYWLLK